MEKGGERGERAFYGNGADSGLSPALCSGEPLCSQPLWDYMDLPTSFPPDTHAHTQTQTHTPMGIHRQKHIYRETHRFGCRWSSGSSFGSRKRILSFFSFISGSLCQNEHRHKYIPRTLHLSTFIWLLTLTATWSLAVFLEDPDAS